MREIALFGEDSGHRQVVGTLVKRLADEQGIEARLEWRSAVGGRGQVVQGFKRYLRDIGAQGNRLPDLVVAATDANCKGLNERTGEFGVVDPPPPVVFAIPDPHIERWLLLDGAAFRSAVGRGCDAPDLKCDRDRYKQRLRQAVRNAGIEPSFSGMEFTEDIVRHMDIERVAKADRSFKRFVDDLNAAFRRWRGG